MLFDRVIVEIISSIKTGVLRGVFLANQLASTDNQTRTTNTWKTKLDVVLIKDDT